MSTITLTCAQCGKQFEKPISEYNRRIKKGCTTFYCSYDCAGIGVNKKRKKPNIEKICPVCDKKFTTSTKAKSATFCSRSCASKGSVTEARKEAGRKSAADHPITGSAQSVALILKKREAWKYEEIKAFLEFIKEPFEFKKAIENFVYDLVLTNKKLIFEFDGPEHKYYITDEEKTQIAKNQGYTLYRIETVPNTKINPSAIYPYLK